MDIPYKRYNIQIYDPQNMPIEVFSLHWMNPMLSNFASEEPPFQLWAVTEYSLKVNHDFQQKYFLLNNNFDLIGALFWGLLRSENIYRHFLTKKF